MNLNKEQEISEVEEFLRGKFDKSAPTSGVPSTAGPATASARIDQLVLPDEVAEFVAAINQSFGK